jgi:hypothetical protein
MSTDAALLAELNKFHTDALCAQQNALLQSLFIAWNKAVRKQVVDTAYVIDSIGPMVKWLEDKDRRERQAKRNQAAGAPLTGYYGVQGLSDNDDDEDMDGCGDEIDAAWEALKEAYHREVRSARNDQLGTEEVPWDAVVQLAMDFQNFKPQPGVLCSCRCHVVLGGLHFVLELDAIGV